jgi:methenyltetrahydromethanopterin cyclohydrolase
MEDYDILQLNLTHGPATVTFVSPDEKFCLKAKVKWVEYMDDTMTFIHPITKKYEEDIDDIINTTSDRDYKDFLKQVKKVIERHFYEITEATTISVPDGYLHMDLKIIVHLKTETIL